MKQLTLIKKEKGMIPSFMLEASGIIPFMITNGPLPIFKLTCHC